MRTDLAIIVVLTTLLCAVGCVKEFPETVPQEEMEKVFEEVKGCHSESRIPGSGRPEMGWVVRVGEI